jgi:hypothetical protein
MEDVFWGKRWRPGIHPIPGRQIDQPDDEPAIVAHYAFIK